MSESLGRPRGDRVSPRVAVVIPRYYPVLGGAESQCRLLNLHLMASGEVRIPLLVTHRLRQDLLAFESIDGIPVYRVGRPGIGRRSNYGLLMQIPWFLWRSRTRFDMVHCHSTGPLGFVVAGVCRLMGKPAVLKISANGELFRSFDLAGRAGLAGRTRRGVRRFMAQKTCQWSYIIALNQEGLEEAREVGAAQVEVIPNGVELKEFLPASAPERERLRGLYRFYSDDILLLFAGRFTKVKGIDILLPAFRQVTADPHFHRAYLLLAGSGALQGRSVDGLVERERECSDGRVRILEPIFPPVPYFQMADALVHPSRHEGLPNVVLEALASSLPCLLSDISPHRELREQNPEADIRLFRSGDSGDLATQMRQLLKDLASRQPGQVLRRGLSQDFSIQHVSARYVDLYRRLQEGSI